jgi:predicted MFS family arabinose efflux permease
VVSRREANAPTAILSQGSAFGVILAVPALNWIIVNHSWHYAFGALGVVGLMWVVAWLVMGKEGRWCRRSRWPPPIRAFPISSF